MCDVDVDIFTSFLDDQNFTQAYLAGHVEASLSEWLMIYYDYDDGLLLLLSSTTTMIIIYYYDDDYDLPLC